LEKCITIEIVSPFRSAIIAAASTHDDQQARRQQHGYRDHTADQNLQARL
jgi:hypothetical protein